jgi:hypothetical protein
MNLNLRDTYFNGDGVVCSEGVGRAILREISVPSNVLYDRIRSKLKLSSMIDNRADVNESHKNISIKRVNEVELDYFCKIENFIFYSMDMEFIHSFCPKDGTNSDYSQNSESLIGKTLGGTDFLMRGSKKFRIKIPTIYGGLYPYGSSGYHSNRSPLWSDNTHDKSPKSGFAYLAYTFPQLVSLVHKSSFNLAFIRQSDWNYVKIQLFIYVSYILTKYAGYEFEQISLYFSDAQALWRTVPEMIYDDLKGINIV